MRDIHRKLLWLVVILTVWNGLFYFITNPPGAFFDLEGWLVKPIYALNFTALVNWAVLYVIL